MSLSTLQELVAHRAKLMPLTVEQYHRMLRSGILQDGDPYELLNGYLVRKDRNATGADPMTIGPDHAGGVDRIGLLNRDLWPLGCYVRLQQPVTMLPDSEPEPDGALVWGDVDDYAKRHPGPGDILCIFEVADSSLQRDRSTKQRIYADAGVPLYVITNLLDRVVEAHANPLKGQGRYADVRVLHPGETFRVQLNGDSHLDVPVDALLPKS